MKEDLLFLKFEFEENGVTVDEFNKRFDRGFI